MTEETPPTQEPCRLCGKHRVFEKKRNPYKKDNYRDVILKVIGLDVTDDDPWVPTYVCRMCVLKMQRQKLIVDRKRSGTLQPWTLPVFPMPQDQTAFEALFPKVKSIAQLHGFSSFYGPQKGTFTRQHPITGDVLIKVVLTDDFQWKVQYMGKDVPKTSPVLAEIPQVASIETLQCLFKSVAFAHVCQGNVDFPSVMDSMRRDVLLGKDQKTVVGYKHNACLRDIDCTLLLKSDERCTHCEEFRNNLRSRKGHLKRKFQSPIVPGNQTLVSKMTTAQISAKLSSMSPDVAEDPSWQLPEFSKPPNHTPFDDFFPKAELTAATYGFLSFCDETKGTFMKADPKNGDILIKVVVLSTFQWTVQYRGDFVPKTSPVLCDIPTWITIDALKTLFSRLSTEQALEHMQDFSVFNWNSARNKSPLGNNTKGNSHSDIEKSAIKQEKCADVYKNGTSNQTIESQYSDSEDDKPEDVDENCPQNIISQNYLSSKLNDRPKRKATKLVHCVKKLLIADTMEDIVEQVQSPFVDVETV